MPEADTLFANPTDERAAKALLESLDGCRDLLALMAGVMELLCDHEGPITERMRIILREYAETARTTLTRT